jgi:dolichyl-phosphate-mannose--protein O-mannosyl transferase
MHLLRSGSGGEGGHFLLLHFLAVITVLLSLFGANLLVECRGLREVTCGSVFKLVNSAYNVRLHSHDIKYGSGSGQQSVTGTDIKEDVNSNWAVKGAPKSPCVRG